MTTTTILNAEQRVSDDKTSCARAQHIHIVSCSCNDHINYGNEVDEVDDKTSNIAPQDGNDVNNNGSEVNKVDDEASYITLPDG